uniref:FTP domain-containing protein n=2 Tax=Macrostomum lignano TaxID=282301 RepID=A0A1I8HTE8_9PLAT
MNIIGLILLAMCLPIITDCRNFFMVPKNLTAKQSTKYQTEDNPNLVNNGDRSGTYVSGVTCTHASGDDPGPWWLLDMGQTYLISGVNIWNRLDNDCAQRFTHSGVGITSDLTVWTDFSIDLLDPCHFRTDVPTVADNPLKFTCARPTSGRYLAVYKNLTGVPDLLTGFHFCEIDIYAFTKDSSKLVVTETQASFSASSTAGLLTASAPHRVRSQLECMLLCSSHPYCLYALTRTTSAVLECWLFSSFSIPTSFISLFNNSSNDGVRFLGLYGGLSKP